MLLRWTAFGVLVLMSIVRLRLYLHQHIRSAESHAHPSPRFIPPASPPAASPSRCSSPAQVSSPDPPALPPLIGTALRALPR